jgi:hypothetical protein
MKNDVLNNVWRNVYNAVTVKVGNNHKLFKYNSLKQYKDNV